MPWNSRSNGKAGLSQNISGGVTILQWFKRFDATLGLSDCSALHDYSKKLHIGRAFA
jgi:hypothetical protein